MTKQEYARIVNLKRHIKKILNTDYPDKPEYWESVGRCIAALNVRIAMIREGRV